MCRGLRWQLTGDGLQGNDRQQQDIDLPVIYTDFNAAVFRAAALVYGSSSLFTGCPYFHIHIA